MIADRNKEQCHTPKHTLSNTCTQCKRSNETNTVNKLYVCILFIEKTFFYSFFHKRYECLHTRSNVKSTKSPSGAPVPLIPTSSHDYSSSHANGSTATPRHHNTHACWFVYSGCLTIPRISNNTYTQTSTHTHTTDASMHNTHTCTSHTITHAVGKTAHHPPRNPKSEATVLTAPLGALLRLPVLKPRDDRHTRGNQI